MNELNAIQYLKNGTDLFDKLATERGFPTKRAQTYYAWKLYEMLQNVQATLEDLLEFFEWGWNPSLGASFNVLFQCVHVQFLARFLWLSCRNFIFASSVVVTVGGFQLPCAFYRGACFV
ncbi:unnamed protein product [Prorocentrum cordatum]|uniref:Uncharacterized protein n=1 Tax=Prorocentrum cordatum TaxID=2364126 RepID=A0ABN9W3Z6_9DINO|nr:unnamed protein product [Polarella glacialis]